MNTLERYVRSITNEQLIRLYFRVWDEISYAYGNPGHFGWDWITLKMIFPGFHDALKVIRAEGRSRGL